MNFDADRLSRLSGLCPVQNTNVITESANTDSRKSLNEGCGCDAQPCGCVPPAEHEEKHEMAHAEDEVLFEMEEEPEEEPAPEEVEESAALTMETLRDTVLELRNEILAEQAEERQALAEAPARTAIRREIKALLAEMPADAATNWIYGKKGKPSAHNKSRATALAGVGFVNSKN